MFDQVSFAVKLWANPKKGQMDLKIFFLSKIFCCENPESTYVGCNSSADYTPTSAAPIPGSVYIASSVSERKKIDDCVVAINQYDDCIETSLKSDL